PTRVIARLSGARAAAIVSRGRDGERRLVAGLGEHLANRSALILPLGGPPGGRLNGSLGDDERAEGELILDSASRPADETLSLCREIAASFLAAGHQTGPWAGPRAAPWDAANSAPRKSNRSKWWPRGAAWKAKILARLQQRMITRSLFVERALR